MYLNLCYLSELFLSNTIRDDNLGCRQWNFIWKWRELNLVNVAALYVQNLNYSFKWYVFYTSRICCKYTKAKTAVIRVFTTCSFISRPQCFRGAFCHLKTAKEVCPSYLLKIMGWLCVSYTGRLEGMWPIRTTVCRGGISSVQANNCETGIGQPRMLNSLFQGQYNMMQRVSSRCEVDSGKWSNAIMRVRTWKCSTRWAWSTPWTKLFCFLPFTR